MWFFGIVRFRWSYKAFMITIRENGFRNGIEEESLLIRSVRRSTGIASPRKSMRPGIDDIE